MLKLTVSADCLLEGIGLELENSIKEALTIDNPQYTSAKKFGRWVGKNLKPTLTYYEVLPRAIRFPRGFANRAVILCRQSGHDPEIIDERQELPSFDMSFAGILRPYQEEAVGLVCKRSFGVLEAGTGSGKTIMALSVIARRSQPTLVIVHTKELLYQWRDRAEQFLGCEVGLVGDGKFSIKPLTIAIVNTARKRAEELNSHFGQLIVDECHRVPAGLFTDVVSHFPCKYLLGLSATAFRRDDEMTKLIYYFMGDRIHKVDQEELQSTGAVLKPEHLVIKTDFDYNYNGDFQALMKALVEHEGRNRKIIGDIKSCAGSSTAGIVLVVSDRVGHCQLFVDSLQKHGINAEILTGQSSAEERARIVGSVRSGQVDVLVSTIQLISEGFDCPGLGTLFLTTPISFEGRLLQVIGRIMRPAKGKRPKVYDYVDELVTPLLRSAKNRRDAFKKL
ncbi:MAG: DEAD/DEAH box helicase [Desulfotalea sp.]